MNTLQSILEVYRENLQVCGLKENSIDSTIGRIQVFADALSTTSDCKSITDIQVGHVETALAEIKDAGYASSTRKGISSNVRCLFRWLYAGGQLLSDPTRTLEQVSYAEAPLPPAPLSELEIFQLIDSIPNENVIDLRNKATVELMYGCGLRVSECLGLSLDNLDLKAQTVFIKGKGGHERIMPLMSGAVTALNKYLTLRNTLVRGPDMGDLFISRRGNQLSPITFGKWLTSHAAKTLGPERRVHPHLLRHSIAVHLLRGGSDIRHIQSFLGHQDINTSKIYMRLHVNHHIRADYDRSMPDLM